MDISKAIESLKGISGSGNVLSQVAKALEDRLLTLEPADIAGNNKVQAAPIGYDLWYIWYHQNLMQKYYVDVAGANFKHYDYSTYLSNNLSFLSYLPGLKPLKVLTDLKSIDIAEGFYSIIPSEYRNNGIYWINTSFFELWNSNLSPRYNSDSKIVPHYKREQKDGRWQILPDAPGTPTYGSSGYLANPNNYVGYLAFPVGQLGLMEVISLVQETDLSGYKFTAVDSSDAYHKKLPLTDPDDKYKPFLKDPPEMFPAMKDDRGNQLAGMNYCFGKHLIESGYYKPTTPMSQQNKVNSAGVTASTAVADKDVEFMAANIKDYGESIEPKLWMRFWIHKDSTMPVPGEFIGILCRPVAAPPHVWWFQESSPFLYAGNWMETKSLTSGIVKEVILEAARTDGGTGNLYKVSVQGCIIEIESSDFLSYSVGDRVAILKTLGIGTSTQSYSEHEQIYLKDSDSFTKTLVMNSSYIILPLSYYKVVK